MQYIFDTFNQYHPRINFTMELEKDNKLNFLDIMVHRDVDGNIFTNWYRKPTYSGRVLNYLSDHPYQHKIGIIKSLTDKAVKLSHKKFHAQNLKYVNEILLLNNYPQFFITKHMNQRINEIDCKNKNNNVSNNSDENLIINNNFSNRNIFKLPYINEKISKSIRHLYRIMVSK